jgi:hypothetical protein
MPGTAVAHAHHQELGRAPAFDRDLDLAPTCVHERVARDLGHRGGDARLVLAVEAEAGGDLPGPLTSRDHVLLVTNEERGEEHAHGRITKGRAGPPRP